MKIKEVAYYVNRLLDGYASAHLDSFNKYKHLREDTIAKGVGATFVDSLLGAGIGYKIIGEPGITLGASAGFAFIFCTNFAFNYLKHELPGDLVEEAVLKEIKKKEKLTDDELEEISKFYDLVKK